MHVLITRPEPDCRDLKSRIEGLGCEVTIAPLIDIALIDIGADAVIGAAGLIATSRNGLRALTQSPALEAALHLPLFAVGPATAALARELGFKTVITGAGTAADLVPLIKAHAGAQPGTLTHLAGDHLAFDLRAALEALGCSYRQIEAYRSVAAKTLAEPVAGLLARRQLDAVILMSPRTARVWAELIQSLPKMPDITKLTHICLSPAIVQGLRALGAVRTDVAAAPNGNEIVALVYRLARSSKTG